MSTFHKILGFLFAVLFGLSALLQYNDPDPLLWVLIYTIAAIISLLFALYRVKAVVPAVMGMLCFIGFLYLYPSNFQGFDLNDGDIETVELGREAFGLLIISLIMFLFTFWSQKKSKI